MSPSFGKVIRGNARLLRPKSAICLVCSRSGIGLVNSYSDVFGSSVEVPTVVDLNIHSVVASELCRWVRKGRCDVRIEGAGM